MTSNNLTIVSIAWRKKRRNHRLLFGTPRDLIRLDWRRRLAVFDEGQIFGYERWRANQYGTIDWQVFVIKAGRPGCEISAVNGIQPDAIILLAARGKTATKHTLEMLNLISLNMALIDVSEEIWREISHRNQARLPIEPLFMQGAFK